MHFVTRNVDSTREASGKPLNLDSFIGAGHLSEVLPSPFAFKVLVCPDDCGGGVCRNKTNHTNLDFSVTVRI